MTRISFENTRIFFVSLGGQQLFLFTKGFGCEPSGVVKKESKRRVRARELYDNNNTEARHAYMHEHKSAQ